MPTQRILAPDENKAYTQTVLGVMVDLVAEGAKDATVKKIADSLKRANDYDTLQNDFQYLKRRITYIPDPPTIERIYSAKYTIGKGYGEDCDGMSVATATLLSLQGIPWRFRAIAWRKPEFTHVFTIATIDNDDIVFDLTFPVLGITHSLIFNYLDTPMQTIHAISDIPNDVMVAGNLFSNDLKTQINAFRYLHAKYPGDMMRWATMVAQEKGMSRNLGLSDGMGDWLSSVLGSVSGMVSNFILPGSGAAVSGIVSNVAGGTSGSESSGNADPKRPGRSITDARTYMDELTAIYDSGNSPKGDATVDNDYATVIHVPTLPQLDQHIDTDHPGHIFLSWDGGQSWISDYSLIMAEPSGNAYKLSYKTEAGDVRVSPNYYQRTQFSDGAERFDNIGSVPSRAKPVQAKDPDTQASTAETGGHATSGPSSTIPPGGEQSPTTTGASGTTGATQAGTGTDVLKQAQSFFTANNMPLIIGGIAIVAILLSKK